jgi:hypothetical protein
MQHPAANPAVNIVETISLSEILYIYEHMELKFTFMCFAIAKIFENRNSFKVTDDPRRLHSLEWDDSMRFRDAYDCLNRTCPGVLSAQTETQLIAMLREIGYDMQGLDSTSFTVSMLCAYEGTTLSYHNFRIKLLKAILAVKPYACFHFVING